MGKLSHYRITKTLILNSDESYKIVILFRRGGRFLGCAASIFYSKNGIFGTKMIYINLFFA